MSYCPKHGGRSSTTVIDNLRCDCLKDASTAAKHHLELCRALLAPIAQKDRIAVLKCLAADAMEVEVPTAKEKESEKLAMWQAHDTPELV